MSRLIAFDFDGVVIDSVNVLKTVYYDFLSQFGKTGSDAEFDALNGPTIQEIVAILKYKYNLEESSTALIDKYHGMLTEAYSSVALMEGIRPVLEELTYQEVDLALVTSSVKSEVESILRKYKIDKKFKIVITGDDIKESKPSPEIYLLLKELCNEDELWTIEDSENGIKSARGANVNVVYYDQQNIGTAQRVDCRINKISDIPLIFKGVEKGFCVIEKTSEINVSVEDGYFPSLNYSKSKNIEQAWKEALSSKDLHDGKVLYYQSHKTNGQQLTVKAYWGSYKYFYCTVNHPELGLNFVPLAVSGVCLDERGFTLTAKRKNVTEYANSCELVPSGGISESVAYEGSIDFHKQLLTELFEEASIKTDNVLEVQEIGIVRDLSNQVVDICCRIDLDTNAGKFLVENEEYSLLSWVDPENINCDEVIPTSRGILSILDENRNS
jgi:HAD superfamily hydrolase (TIGR01509 family)